MGTLFANIEDIYEFSRSEVGGMGRGAGWWTRGGGLGPNPKLRALQGLVQACPWDVETLGRNHDGEEVLGMVEE